MNIYGSQAHFWKVQWLKHILNAKENPSQVWAYSQAACLANAEYVMALALGK